LPKAEKAENFCCAPTANYTTAHSLDFSALKPDKSQKGKKFAEGGKKAESACYTPTANYTTAHSLDFSALKPDKSQRGKKICRRRKRKKFLLRACGKLHNRSFP
jgi:hypothetical protein